MKYALIIPDGAADEPVPQLDGRTPLMVARKPNTDWVSVNGRQGRSVTVPKGFLPGSDVAILSLFGYDPKVCFDGRAPLEAAAKGISTTSDELIFRCNLVTVADGLMADFTAGHISQAETEQIIADLNEHLAGERCTFHSGVSYRNLLVVSDADDINVNCTPPHDFPNKPTADHMPTGPGNKWVRELMERARIILKDHDVNRGRRDLGENPATDIWLWGQGRSKSFESFKERFGLSVAVITAVDLVRGIALSGGMKLIDVPGATGYLDTDYQAKGKAAVEALEEFDMVVVHVESPDEAGHQGSADEKIKAIEQIDEHVVGPVLEALKRCDKWRILISPDHPTPVGSRLHTATPPPFCMAGHAVHSVLAKPFTEDNAARSDLQINPGHDLMEYFLKV